MSLFEVFILWTLASMLGAMTGIGMDRLLSVEPTSGAEHDFSGDWNRLRDRWRGATRDDLWNHAVAQAFVAFFRSVEVSASRKRPPSAINLVQRFVLGETPHPLRLIHPL